MIVNIIFIVVIATTKIVLIIKFCKTSEVKTCMIDNDKCYNSKHQDGLPWYWFVPGLEINKSGSRLLQQFLLLRFSNVVKRKRNTHSKPNKGRYQHKVIYTASNTHTTQSLNVSTKKTTRKHKNCKLLL